MQLSGHWDKRVDAILKKISVACDNIESQLLRYKESLEKKVALRLYNDISAVTGALIVLSKQEKATSEVVYVILRTLLEGSISMFAFCREPSTRAKMYWDFDAVLDWKWACLDKKHIGTPWLPSEEKVNQRKNDAKEVLTRVGEPFIIPKKGQSNADRLKEALDKSKTGYLRDRWYPGRRAEVLRKEGMEWVYDVLYRRLCSAVHSDSAASKVLGTADRGNTATLVLQVWGAAIYKLVDAFSINLPAEHKGLFRMWYKSLQGKT